MTERLDPAGDAGAKMKSRQRTDLREAMKGRRASEAAPVRVLLAAIDNAEAPPLDGSRKAADQHRFRDGSAEVERLSLSEAAVRAILAAEVLERETVAAQVMRLNRADRAEALSAEALLARRYIE